MGINQIILKGFLRDIQPSHIINDIEYDKANFVVPRANGKEDIINLKFKKFSNPYRENQEIEIVGNIRSYSRQLADGKNKVDIYVFTYFDRPSSEVEIINQFEVDGRICKIDELRKTESGKHNVHFILANNIITDLKGQKLNNYLPCVGWGKMAKELTTYQVNDHVKIKGELHSREYKKQLENGDIVFKIAHELVISEIEKLDE